MLRTVMMMWTDRCRWRGNEGIDGLFVDIVATQERFEWKASEDVTMPRSNRSTGSWIKAWRSPHPRVPSLQNSICISFDQFSCRHTVVVAPLVHSRISASKATPCICVLGSFHDVLSGYLAPGLHICNEFTKYPRRSAT